CSSAAVSSSSTTGPSDAAGGSRSDAALDAPASDASDASAAPTHLDGAFTARGATFRTSVTTNGQGMLDIAFADVDDVCRTARTDKLSRVLHLTLRAEGAITAGTFAIVNDTVLGGSGPAPQATAVVWSIYDVGSDVCSLSNDDQGISGSITLTSVGAGAIEGTLDLALAKGGVQVQGAFGASLCAQPLRPTFACPLAL
ncbi:MAG TPA: hypothetical protein VLT33_06100, partial [Labilithrix sp.]|nr:hypothetical protein [Labilithrix sp.]